MEKNIYDSENICYLNLFISNFTDLKNHVIFQI
jgi:hypothetical protein